MPTLYTVFKCAVVMRLKSTLPPIAKTFTVTVVQISVLIPGVRAKYLVDPRICSKDGVRVSNSSGSVDTRNTATRYFLKKVSCTRAKSGKKNKYSTHPYTGWTRSNCWASISWASARPREVGLVAMKRGDSKP